MVISDDGVLSSLYSVLVYVQCIVMYCIVYCIVFIVLLCVMTFVIGIYRDVSVQHGQAHSGGA